VAEQDSLSGRVALVTGAARGIGAAVAAHLASQGAAVAICDLDQASAEACAARLEVRAPRRAIGLRMDVGDGASIGQGVAAVAEQLGPISILVNNAGIDIVGPFLASTEADWRRVVNVNLWGTLRCTREVVPGMVERRFGTVICIASDAGKVGSSGEAVYSATKGGIIAFSKTLAREVAASGVTVNCVCPGPTDTALLGQVADVNPRLRAALERAIPLRRVAQPDDIAGVVAFLAGPHASYITGQALSVSGGLTMT
jgi:2-hydroxycyclohexanecarboxyl-CoA dehydrogenase